MCFTVFRFHRKCYGRRHCVLYATRTYRYSSHDFVGRNNYCFARRWRARRVYRKTYCTRKFRRKLSRRTLLAIWLGSNDSLSSCIVNDNGIGVIPLSEMIYDIYIYIHITRTLARAHTHIYTTYDFHRMK